MKFVTVQLATSNGRSVAAFRTPYEAKDVIKGYVPHEYRSWLKELKLWQVWDVANIDAAIAALRYYGYDVTVDDKRATQVQPQTDISADWATKMFKALPVELHTKAYRALVKVLHPDTGGDTEAMQDLSLAYESKV